MIHYSKVFTHGISITWCKYKPFLSITEKCLKNKYLLAQEESHLWLSLIFLHYHKERVLLFILLTHEAIYASS